MTGMWVPTSRADLLADIRRARDHVLNAPEPTPEPMWGYLVVGEHCDRCGDTNYDPDTRVCLTCTYPDDPSSRAYLDGRAEA
jgi:hypothetical protein